MTFPIPLVTKFIAAAPAEYLSGKHPSNKIKSAEKIFARFDGFTGATHRVYQKNKYILAFFSSEEELKIAMQLKCTYSEIDPNFTPQSADPSLSANSASLDAQNPIQATIPNKIIKEYYFKDFHVINAPKTADQLLDEKQRTVQILDLPLGISFATVRFAL